MPQKVAISEESRARNAGSAGQEANGDSLPSARTAQNGSIIAKYKRRTVPVPGNTADDGGPFPLRRRNDHHVVDADRDPVRTEHTRRTAVRKHHVCEYAIIHFFHHYKPPLLFCCQYTASDVP